MSTGTRLILAHGFNWLSWQEGDRMINGAFLSMLSLDSASREVIRTDGAPSKRLSLKSETRISAFKKHLNDFIDV